MDIARTFALSRMILHGKAIPVLLAAMCAAAAVAQGQQPGSESGAAAKIRSLEDARFEAQGRRDNVALDALLDNALVWVNHDGSVQTKADYLAKIRTGGPNPIQIAPESMTVRALGNTATVVGIYREKVIAGGQAYSLRYRFINTWAFQHGKWVCIAAAAAASAK